MSLINDALKRASQAEKDRPRETTFHPPLQPARSSHRSLLPLIIGVIVLLLLLLAGFIFWRTLATMENPEPSFSAAPATRPARPPATPKIEPPPAAVPAPEPVAVPVVTQPAAVAAPVVETPPPPPAFPELKLQGIFFSRRNPKATINGQIRGENEKVGDVRIVKISPDEVTVDFNGQTKILRMEGQ